MMKEVPNKRKKKQILFGASHVTILPQRRTNSRRVTCGRLKRKITAYSNPIASWITVSCSGYSGIHFFPFQLHLQGSFPKFSEAVIFGNKRGEVVAERCTAITTFLNYACANVVIRKSKALQEFLAVICVLLFSTCCTAL